ncbi:MAG TPA: hypothetical protein VM286_09950 [Candidatus Thermoplasmatota archaeon]|nr:hypothetical protein [Candidatus Thermoplasmatota archaeon]
MRDTSVPDRPASALRALTIASAALLVATLVPTAAAQSCQEGGHNVQCSELGTIRMDSVREIRGDPIKVQAQVLLNSNFKDHGARWFLFSVRNVTSDGTNPIMINVEGFTADGAPVVTSKKEVKSFEADFWVDVEDVPVGKTITIDMTVGAADAGAFQLETLVMSFDRGYAPVLDSTGAEASLFSFTLLGVKSATGSVGAGPLSDGYSVPGLGLPALLAAVGAALLVRRRFA